MKYFEQIFILICLFIGSSFQNEETHFNMSQLVEANDFVVKEYEVTTEDGYLLLLYRIVSPESEGKIPVLFLHGLTFSSVDWVVLGSDNSIAYYLADKNYDVWLGNNRGNYYSKRYADKNKRIDKDFWDFSFHEMGIYDLPAFIDTILEETGQEQIVLIGHSIGATQFLIMNSERSKAYGGKVKFAVLLSPVAFVDHIKSNPSKFLTNVAPITENIFGNFNFLPYKGFDQRFWYIISRIPPARFLISNRIKSFYGPFCDDIDKASYPMIYSHYSAGSSTKPFYHLTQLYRDRTKANGMHFRLYNYGKNNIVRYGQNDPPEYILSKTTQPVAIFAGTNDWAADLEDVKYLTNKLPNVVKFIIGNNNHVLYLWGKNIQNTFAESILQLIEDNTG